MYVKELSDHARNQILNTLVSGWNHNVHLFVPGNVVVTIQVTNSYQERRKNSDISCTIYIYIVNVELKSNNADSLTSTKDFARIIWSIDINNGPTPRCLSQKHHRRHIQFLDGSLAE